eukprot:10869340-Karenia_brevis.AAC.1
MQAAAGTIPPDALLQQMLLLVSQAQAVPAAPPLLPESPASVPPAQAAQAAQASQQEAPTPGRV